ncbi:MAG: hypothetical protein K0S36_2050 [Nitrosospira multiformis]|nr:hypothetical protein [Nitrosospira multiformis]
MRLLLGEDDDVTRPTLVGTLLPIEICTRFDLAIRRDTAGRAIARSRQRRCEWKMHLISITIPTSTTANARIAEASVSRLAGKEDY